MTDYTIISRFRNKFECELLVEKLRGKRKTCYNFCDKPADPENPLAHPEDQMKVHESTDIFLIMAISSIFLKET